MKWTWTLVLICACGTTTPFGSTEDGGATDAEVARDATRDTSADARTDGPVDVTDAGDDAVEGSLPCNALVECRLFASYCGSCSCKALRASESDPACDAGTITCLIDPCVGHRAACDANHQCLVQ